MESVLIGIFLLSNFASVLSSPIKYNPNAEPNAIGGSEVSISIFPYQTAIYARHDTGSKLCSGAILSRKIVITCAHCLVGSNSASVYYGSENLSALDFSRNQVIDRNNYIFHPQYSQYVNDVALIMMNFDIEFSDRVKPLQLPRAEDVTNAFEDKKLSMASWGYYSDEKEISENLRFVEMEAISLTECATTYPPPLISSNVICTKESHCAGDSGSMLVDKSINGEYVAVGLASFSYDNCEGIKPRPAVFMRVSSHLDFIMNFIDLIDD